MLNQCALCEVVDSLSFSAICCNFFKLLSQITWKLCCFRSVLSFYDEVFPIRRDDTVWLSITPTFHRAIPIPTSFMYSSGPLFFTKRHLPPCCWMVAMVGQILKKTINKEYILNIHSRLCLYIQTYIHKHICVWVYTHTHTHTVML